MPQKIKKGGIAKMKKPNPTEHEEREYKSRKKRMFGENGFFTKKGEGILKGIRF